MSGVVQSAGQFLTRTGTTANRLSILRVVVLLLVILLIGIAVSLTLQHHQPASVDNNQTTGLTVKTTSQPILPHTTTSSLKTEVDQATTPSPTPPATSTHVYVNGQSVPLPPNGNGTVHKVVPSDGSDPNSVTITVHSNSTSTSSSSNSSTLNLNVDSTQSTTNDSG